MNYRVDPSSLEKSERTYLKWNDALVDRVRALIKEKKTMQEIADILGTSRMSIRHQMSYHCIRSRIHFDWSANRHFERLIKMLEDGKSAKDVAEVFGTTESVVRHQMLKQGIKPCRQLKILQRSKNAQKAASDRGISVKVLEQRILDAVLCDETLIDNVLDDKE